MASAARSRWARRRTAGGKRSATGAGGVRPCLAIEVASGLLQLTRSGLEPLSVLPNNLLVVPEVALQLSQLNTDEQAAPMVKQMMPPTTISAMPTGSGSLLHRFWYLMRRL